MINLTRLNPRERRLALIAVLAIGCWVIVSWLVEPLWNRASSLRRHVTVQLERFDVFSRLLEDSPAIEREYRRIADYLAQTEEEVGTGTFLSELEALSRRSNLQLNLRPRTLKDDGRFARAEVELDVEGSQGSLLAFLDLLFAHPQLITIEQLRLSTVPAKEQRLRARIVVQQLILR